MPLPGSLASLLAFSPAANTITLWAVMSSRKTGIVCAVRGCHNNWYKRKSYLEHECYDHRPRTRNVCGCEAPYDLHPPPKDEDTLRLWIQALQLLKPPKRPYVCSFHFVDKRPTAEHPLPEKWLGYDVPVRTTRRVSRRAAAADDRHCDGDNDWTAPITGSPEHTDAVTGWDVPALMDHSYILIGKKKDVCDEEPFAHAILKSESSSVLYTGLSLSAFFDRVKCLQQSYTADFKMHVTDQILMTMMKLKLDVVQGDLAEWFAVSQGEVSRILSYWIEMLVSMQGEVKQEEINQDDIIKQKDINQEDIKKEEIKQEDIKQEDINQEDIKQVYIKKEDIKQEDTDYEW